MRDFKNITELREQLHQLFSQALRMKPLEEEQIDFLINHVVVRVDDL